MRNAETKLLVKHLMTRDVFTLYSHNTIAVLSDLLDWQRIRHVPVVNREGQLVGLVTHRDLLRAAAKGAHGVKVEEIMQREVKWVDSQTPLSEAARILYSHKFGCLPVVDDGSLVGIITEADFVRAFIE